MSTGSDLPTAGKPNLKLWVPDEITGEPSPPQTPPDSCQLQADAVGAAGKDVSTALEILRQRLAILRECRQRNSQTSAGFQASDFENAMGMLDEAKDSIQAAIKLMGYSGA